MGLKSLRFYKDGMFGGKELTNEQNEAMRKITSDTDINFSFIIGFIYAFVISTTVYMLTNCKTSKKEKWIKNHHQH